jgi:hypothetical protein
MALKKGLFWRFIRVMAPLGPKNPHKGLLAFFRFVAPNQHSHV